MAVQLGHAMLARGRSALRCLFLSRRTLIGAEATFLPPVSASASASASTFCSSASALAPASHTTMPDTGTETTPPGESLELDFPQASANIAQVPRWSQTPAAMKAPLQMDFAKDPHNKIWSTNTNPARLDQMYNRLLGLRGSSMLPEELKWLAVTHKSFDQGRRGFNDRLALMGRVALMMETAKYIVGKPSKVSREPDEFDRIPFEHPQMAPVDNLSFETPKDIVGKEKLHALAVRVGIPDVLRWKPRLVTRMESSGFEVVTVGALMAIIGAITLQRGSAVAGDVVRQRILAKLSSS